MVKRIRLCGRPVRQAPAPLVIELEHVAHAGLGRQFPGKLPDLWPADEEAGRGVAEKIVDLVTLIGVVQRQVDGAGPQAAQVEEERLRGFPHLHRDAVPRLHPERDEQTRVSGGFLLQPAVADLGAVGQDQAGRIRVAGKAAPQYLIEILVHIPPF